MPTCLGGGGGGGRRRGYYYCHHYHLWYIHPPDYDDGVYKKISVEVTPHQPLPLTTIRKGEEMENLIK